MSLPSCSTTGTGARSGGYPMPPAYEPFASGSNSVTWPPPSTSILTGWSMTYEQFCPGWYGPGPPRGLDGPVGVPVGPLANGQSTVAFSAIGTGVVAPTWPPTTGLQLAPLAPPGPPVACA